jgi:protease II
VNYKVVVASVDNPSKSTWTDFVSHQHNVRIDDLDMFEVCVCGA